MKPSSARCLWILAVAVSVTGLSIIAFRQLYGAEAISTTARSLIGRPIADARQTLGEPSKVLKAKEFNSIERANIKHSFTPKEVPLAHGSVWIYNRMPTVIVLYEQNETVAEVYVGQS